MNNDTKASILYTMTLDETRHLDRWAVTRVPGGWIYDSLFTEGPESVFVPFSNEFQKSEHIEAIEANERFKIGDKVTFVDGSHKEHGIFKCYDEDSRFAFVSYNPEGLYDVWSNGTAEQTILSNLEKGWL